MSAEEELFRLRGRVQKTIDHGYPYIGLSCFTTDQHAAALIASNATRMAIKRDLLDALLDVTGGEG